MFTIAEKSIKCWGLFFAMAIALASPAGAQEVPAEYTVKKGDTLSKIAEKYLGDPMKWYILMKFNDIDDPNLIEVGQTLKMNNMIAKGEIIMGKVIFVTEGQASYEFGGASRPLKEGDEIPPDGIIVTKDGIVTVKMPDASIVQLSANTRLKVTSLFMNQEDKTQYSFFELMAGKARATVSKLLTGSKFEIRAKSAVAGVRGTEFEILVSDDGDVQFATFEGEVAVKSLKTGETIALPAGQGVALTPKTESFGEVRTLLAAPENVGYRTNPDGSVTFVWDAVPGAEKYALYVAKDNRFEKNQLAGTLNTTTVTFSKFPPGRAFVRIDAIDANGVASMPIKPLMVLLD